MLDARSRDSVFYVLKQLCLMRLVLMGLFPTEESLRDQLDGIENQIIDLLLEDFKPVTVEDVRCLPAELQDAGLEKIVYALNTFDDETKTGFCPDGYIDVLIINRPDSTYAILSDQKLKTAQDVCDWLDQKYPWEEPEPEKESVN